MLILYARFKWIYLYLMLRVTELEYFPALNQIT